MTIHTLLVCVLLEYMGCVIFDQMVELSIILGVRFISIICFNKWTVYHTQLRNHYKDTWIEKVPIATVYTLLLISKSQTGFINAQC